MVSYEEVSYTSKVHRGRHIERLATTAFLRGLKAAHPAKARVLELGCGTGEALVPMAIEYPGTSFYGIDASSTEIDAAKALASKFSLTNINFQQTDIATFNVEAAGKFDYILCHGVYSWCSDVVREKIMHILRDGLAPHGVALVSYNTLPGGFFRTTVAQLLSFYDDASLPIDDRARNLRWVIEKILGSIDYDFEHPYNIMLHRELTRIQNEGEHYLFHEVLATGTKAFMVSDFLTAAERVGLQFLGDARFNRVSLNRLLTGTNPAQGFQNVMQLAKSQSALEQTMDLLFGTAFRETVLCRADVDLDAEVSIDRIKTLAYGGYLGPDGAEVSYTSEEQEFFGPLGHRVMVSKPILKAALTVLHDHFPNYVVFNDLLFKAQEIVQQHGSEMQEFDESVLAGALFEWMQRDAISFALYPPVVAQEVGERPIASRFARWQIENKKPITNLLYETVDIGPLEETLVRYCDGIKEVSSLSAVAQEMITQGYGGITEDGVVVTDPQQIKELIGPLVESSLETIRCAGLLS